MLTISSPKDPMRGLVAAVFRFLDSLPAVELRLMGMEREHVALKYMSVEEMVGATAPLVSPDHPDRQALEREPQLIGLLPALDRSHRQLLDTQQIALTPERLAEIQDQQDGLDFRHDDVIRAVWHCILAVLFMSSDDEVKEQMSELRETLLPDGLSAVNKSYREEVGQARIVESRLTADHRSLMARIPLGQGTLLDAVQEWFELARQLGELDRERSGSSLAAEGSARLSVTGARNQWIRTIRMIRDVLAMLPASEPVIDTILERIATTEQDATRRFQARSGGASDESPDTDEPGEQVSPSGDPENGGVSADPQADPAGSELAVASEGEVFVEGAASDRVANDEVSGEIAVADAG